MKKADTYIGKIGVALAAVCLTGAFWVSSINATPPAALSFDAGGDKIFKRFDETPLAAMTGTDGKRNLNSFYELRQYPGSPPRIPHDVAPSFSGDADECLACHERGGYDSKLAAFAPVTPHPENENCHQCHVPRRTEQLFVESNWLSISPPPLGRSQMASSPPPIPHSLQLREDCIACHTGPAAVAEIRVEHGSRGNCRQCHVPMPASQPIKSFTRK